MICGWSKLVYNCPLLDNMLLLLLLSWSQNNKSETTAASPMGPLTQSLSSDATTMH